MQCIVFFLSFSSYIFYSYVCKTKLDFVYSKCQFGGSIVYIFVLICFNMHVHKLGLGDKTITICIAIDT